MARRKLVKCQYFCENSVQPEIIYCQEHLDYFISFNQKHRYLIENSDCYMCYYCANILLTSDIKEWIDDNQTALCGHCGIDSVIPKQSGIKFDVETAKMLSEIYFNYE